eukprot:SAG31_NODE_2731_length_5175_cov_1.794129_2_plen_63_part_00
MAAASGAFAELATQLSELGYDSPAPVVETNAPKSAKRSRGVKGMLKRGKCRRFLDRCCAPLR